jgi:hypothetical protein
MIAQWPAADPTPTISSAGWHRNDKDMHTAVINHKLNQIKVSGTYMNIPNKIRKGIIAIFKRVMEKFQKI